MIPSKDRHSKRNRRLRTRRSVKQRGHRKSNNIPNARHAKKKALNFITLDSVMKGIPYEVRALKNLQHASAVSLLPSSRWIRTPPHASAEVYLPYIDRLGKFTGSVIHKCKISPQGFISTVVATIFRRIKFHGYRNNKNDHDVNSNQSLLLKCAGYYALTKNVYFWNRILALSKNLKKNKGVISKYLHSVSNKLDEHKWFVYGHVCMQTQWLTSRALRPRDKSALDLEENFSLPSRFREGRESIPIFAYNSVWACFSNMHTMF